MNIRSHTSLSILVLAMLLWSGCNESQESKTTINSDGSILRTERISGDDSASVANAPLPPWVDGTWDILIERTGERMFAKRASKFFPDIAAMNQALAGGGGTSLRFRGSLERRFRWFFTEYSYRETCVRWNPFDGVPITDYVSSSEIDLWFRHEVKKLPYPSRGDSLALHGAEDRAGEWQTRSMFESYFKAFMKGVELLHDSSLTPTILSARKESLFARARQSLEHAPNNTDSLHAVFARLLGPRPVQKVIALNAAGFDLYKQKIEFLERMILMDEVKATIQMPGLIVETNAPAIEGNTAAWADIQWYAYLQDVEMRVESRMVNWWAIVVTGAILLGVVSMTMVGVSRKHRYG